MSTALCGEDPGVDDHVAAVGLDQKRTVALLKTEVIENDVLEDCSLTGHDGQGEVVGGGVVCAAHQPRDGDGDG